MKTLASKRNTRLASKSQTASEFQHTGGRGKSFVSGRRTRSGSPVPAMTPAFSGPALWVVLVLIAVNVIVYAPVRQHDFVNWDDHDYVSENPHVSAGLTWPGVKWAFTTGYAANWHPLTWLSHMLDVELFGVHAGSHLLTNLALHIANTLLLFAVLRRMTGAVGCSAFVAALFAVHPLHVESVAWVSERKDVLSTLFWMLTMWAYVGYARQPRIGRYGLVLAFFALGLLAKAMLVTLPCVLLLLDLWPLRRVALGAEPAISVAGSPTQPSVSWWHLVREKLPLLALALVSSVVTFLVQRQSGAVAALTAFPLSQRLANALIAYVAYMGKAIWPVRLAAFYPYPVSRSGWLVASAVLGLMTVTFVAMRLARRHPYVLVGWLWYLGTLVPVIGLVQVGDQSMADRYTYVPLIGLFVVLAWGVPELIARRRYHYIVLSGMAVVIVMFCAARARTQVSYWSDSVALWEHAVQVTTANYRTYENLGSAFRDRGQFDEALLNYAESARRAPDYAVVYNSMGFVLTKQGRIADAIIQFTTAVRLRPDFADAQVNLGNALAAQGRLSEAVDHFSDAARTNPDLAGAQVGLGSTLLRQGRPADAIPHYNEAIRLEPDLAEAHNGVGAALAMEGHEDQAVANYAEALRLNPDLATAHVNLGLVLAHQGKNGEATDQFLRALDIEPQQASWHYNVAVLLTKQGKIDEAVQHLQTALTLNPNFEEARQALKNLARRRKTGGGAQSRVEGSHQPEPASHADA
jgi:tetratricopeptide (TPR) repeat protein